MPAPLTVAGAEKLRAELSALKNERGTVSRAIGEARKLGDLSEMPTITQPRRNKV